MRLHPRGRPRGRNRRGYYAEPRTPSERELYFIICILSSFICLPRCRLVWKIACNKCTDRRAAFMTGTEAQAFSQNSVSVQGLWAGQRARAPRQAQLGASCIRLRMKREGILEGSGVCPFPITTCVLATSNPEQLPSLSLSLDKVTWTQSPRTCFSGSRTRLPRPVPGAPGLSLPSSSDCLQITPRRGR